MASASLITPCTNHCPRLTGTFQQPKRSISRPGPSAGRRPPSNIHTKWRREHNPHNFQTLAATTHNSKTLHGSCCRKYRKPRDVTLHRNGAIASLVYGKILGLPPMTTVILESFVQTSQSRECRQQRSVFLQSGTRVSNMPAPVSIGYVGVLVILAGQHPCSQISSKGYDGGTLHTSRVES
jgi:hypothetical protein